MKRFVYRVACFGAVYKMKRQRRHFDLLPLFTEYCPAEPKFKLDWPMVAIGKSVTKDCSKINSSWTGT